MAEISIEQTKVCTKCGAGKPLADFHVAADGKFGRRADCKACKCASKAVWRSRNLDYAQSWYSRNKGRAAVWNATRRERDPDFHKKWRDQNREVLRERQLGANARYRAKVKNRISDAVSANIRNSLRSGGKQGRKTFLLLGYTAEDLMAHLERHFQPGMSWDNYGRGGWEIDHIIPLAAHNFETPDHHDFKRAWAITNLQPLWAQENASKNDRLSQPFQPSLAI